MKHIYAFVIKATAGAAILLLAAAILVVEPRESVGQGSGIITDCASTSCAACLPDSTTKQCVNSARLILRFGGLAPDVSPKGYNPLSAAEANRPLDPPPSGMSGHG